MTDPAEVFSEALDAVANMIRTGERIRAALTNIGVAVQSLDDIGDADPELSPELLAALSSIKDTVEALERAQNFIVSKFEVRAEQIFNNLTSEEDDES